MNLYSDVYASCIGLVLQYMMAWFSSFNVYTFIYQQSMHWSIQPSNHFCNFSQFNTYFHFHSDPFNIAASFCPILFTVGQTLLKERAIGL